MKSLILSLAMAASFSAAASTKIYEMRSGSLQEREVSVEFRVNEVLGRAWVSVETAESRMDDIDYNSYRVRVEGMSMNVEKNAVIIEKDGALVECATVTPKSGILGRKLIIRPTGRCTFTPKIVKVDVDNGFEIRKVRMLQVFMNVE